MAKYVFNNLKSITGYCYHHLENPTPIRVQKLMYFCWAYYTSNDPEKSNWPKYLFPSEFVALQYGPINQIIHQWQVNHQIENLPNQLPQTNQFQIETKTLIDHLISQVNHIDDFRLTVLSRKDKAWQIAFAKKQVLNPLQIQIDYRTKN